MQFHEKGFRAGDPDLASAAPRPADPGAVDVLIVGCGPAGLTLAAQLARFPAIHTRIVEQKPGPLELGQADGVACRTMEMFEAFGFCHRVLREAYWVNETAFWTPDPDDGARITRSGRIRDVEDGLSEMPHVILNQARIHEFYLDVMRKALTRLTPDYNRKVVGLSVDRAAERPVTVTLARTDAGHEDETEVVRARYVVGCDGARSEVRRSLGLSLSGDSANQAWGVMDVLAVTDFPDIRLKALIRSAGEGSVVLIPREGGYLARFYIELEKLNPDERIAERELTVDDLIAALGRILHPYRIDVKDVAWWSVYEIGQRLTDRFDDGDDPRVFIAGDACHTHSPKAGQGMNVSMQDAFNLGWKLAAVLEGRSPAALLETYSQERRAVAKELIDFDKEWAGVLSGAGQMGRADPAEVQRYFEKSGRYTAGVETRYPPSGLISANASQTLASGFPVGMRLHSAPVTRLADARPMQLGHAAQADGRWRIYAFADRDGAALGALCDWLRDDPASPIRRHTPAGANIDAVIDLRAVFQQGHREMALEAAHPLLLPTKGPLGLQDYEKMFCPDVEAGDIFETRGVNRDGCIIIARPDQYVAHVLPLDARDDVAAFFAGVMTAR